MKFTSFEELDCWKSCREIRNEVRIIIKKFPSEEKYAITDGMRRSSRSITENIAEGYGRFHYQENIQFCRISRGSLFELIDQYITAKDESYINDEEYNGGRELLNKAIGLLNGYINYLEKAKKNNKK
ncbi:MAG: four helix bundle protein [Bacteroidetes bacterium]|nr:four helix bundle protein [Bacteroidota bacterium]MBL6944150.1 four helix bundle protein [Bacteroidales bacterium]